MKGGALNELAGYCWNEDEGHRSQWRPQDMLAGIVPSMQDFEVPAVGELVLIAV